MIARRSRDAYDIMMMSEEATGLAKIFQWLDAAV